MEENRENTYKLKITEESSAFKTVQRDDFLMYLTDEELDVLEILARKSTRTIENVSKESP